MEGLSVYCQYHCVLALRRVPGEGLSIIHIHTHVCTEKPCTYMHICTYVRTNTHSGTPRGVPGVGLCVVCPLVNNPREDLCVQSVSWCTLRRVPGEDLSVLDHAHMHKHTLWYPRRGARGRPLCVVCPLVTNPREDLCVLSVSWCTLRRVPGEDLFVLDHAHTHKHTLWYPKRGARGRPLCVVCPLVNNPREELIVYAVHVLAMLV